MTSSGRKGKPTPAKGSRRKRATESRRRREKRGEKKPTVFFISTDKATSEKMIEVLDRRGIRCLTFETPNDAINHDELGRARAMVLDLRYPSDDDIALYKILRAGEVSNAVPFIFLVTDKANLSARASGLTMMDYYLSMPVSASVLCETIHQAIVKNKRRTRSIRIAGSMVLSCKIGEISLPEVIQFLQIGKKTGFLHIQSPKAKGLVSFVLGEIHHAEVGPIEGDEAFYLLMSITEGSVQFESGAKPPQRTIVQNITNLLLEGMRQLDEVKSLLDRFASKAAEVENAKQRSKSGGLGILDEF